MLAQPQPADPDRWRAFAEQLPPNALVTVHLTSGERIAGHVLQATPDTLQISPKTASGIPGAVQIIAFGNIQSIDREKEGMSTGVKVAIWTAVVATAAWLIGLWVVAAHSK